MVLPETSAMHGNMLKVAGQKDRLANLAQDVGLTDTEGTVNELVSVGNTFKDHLVG